MKKLKPRSRTSDGLRILDRVTGKDAQLRKDIAEANVNFRVAQLIYDARTAAGMTQRQLADVIGTQQSVIARLEDADYEGHSLTMLGRIAEALHQRLEVTFVPRQQSTSTSRRGTAQRHAGKVQTVNRQA